MNNTTVRRLHPADAVEISRISSSITGAEHRADFQQVIGRQAQSEDDASFVAERDNKLVGYCISYMVSGSFGMEKSAWLALIGVDPNFMGQGIGEMLANGVLKHYKACGITEIYTSVRWDSTDMLSFFKTMGFQRSDFINLHKRLK
ncbi:MAG: GNAT family N-acetyltransferase [Deltaproteobacteria bacterium]|nr:GNAT family N-acetyltransferase [Deltaproteobacteria bacterium]